MYPIHIHTCVTQASKCITMLTLSTPDASSSSTSSSTSSEKQGHHEPRSKGSASMGKEKTFSVRILTGLVWQSWSWVGRCV